MPEGNQVLINWRMENVLYAVKMLHFAEVLVPSFAQMWFRKNWWCVENNEEGCGQNYVIKEGSLAWTKYVDDGDHIDDRDNIPVVPVKIRIKFIVVPTTLHQDS